MIINAGNTGKRAPGIVTGSYIGDGSLILPVSGESETTGSIADGTWSGGKFIELGFRPRAIIVGSMCMEGYSSGSSYWPGVFIGIDESLPQINYNYNEPVEDIKYYIVCEFADTGFYVGYDNMRYADDSLNTEGRTYYYIVIA